MRNKQRNLRISVSSNKENLNDEGEAPAQETGQPGGLSPIKVHWYGSSLIHEDSTDFYSGSWYAPIEEFKNLHRTHKIQTLEDATFTIYNQYSSKARMSVDWLHFAVEHVSRYLRSLDVASKDHSSVAFNKIAEIGRAHV